MSPCSAILAEGNGRRTTPDSSSRRESLWDQSLRVGLSKLDFNKMTLLQSRVLTFVFMSLFMSVYVSVHIAMCGRQRSISDVIFQALSTSLGSGPLTQWLVTHGLV